MVGVLLHIIPYHKTEVVVIIGVLLHTIPYHKTEVVVVDILLHTIPYHKNRGSISSSRNCVHLNIPCRVLMEPFTGGEKLY